MNIPQPKIVVVGAGIVGASIAYHLAFRGASVTVLDKGSGAGATDNAFGWINVSNGPSAALELRRHAIEEWRRLERSLPNSLSVSWCGALSWKSDSAATEGFVRDCVARGYAVRLVESGEIETLEPNLFAPPAVAAFANEEGAVDPTAAMKALILAAFRAGANVHPATEVLALTANNGRIVGVRTNEGAIDADVVVVTAGINASVLCQSIGVDLRVERSPALLLRITMPRSLTNTVISTPDMEIRQATEYRMLAVENYIDDSPENGPSAVAGRALEVIKRQLRGGEALQLEGVRVGARPIPRDGLPLVGFTSGVNGLYVAVMHAGVIMAPIVGRLATTEILDGVTASLLDRFRPERSMDAP